MRGKVGLVSAALTIGLAWPAVGTATTSDPLDAAIRHDAAQRERHRDRRRAPHAGPPPPVQRARGDRLGAAGVDATERRAGLG